MHRARPLPTSFRVVARNSHVETHINFSFFKLVTIMGQDRLIGREVKAGIKENGITKEVDVRIAEIRMSNYPMN